MSTIDYSGAMPNGMSRDYRTRVNAPFFSMVKGFQATPSGLHRYHPVSVKGTPAFPYPDIFYGKRVALAFYATSVADISGVEAGITVYDFATYNWNADAASVGSITSGGQWHFMDNYGTWMAFNGACVVFKAAFSAKVFVTDDTTIKTACNLLEGRAIMAGFNSADSVWGDLGDLFQAMESQLPDQLQGVYAGLDATWAMWTSIGGPELLGLLNVNFLKYGWFDDTQSTGFTDAKTLLLSLVMRGEFGARPLLHSTEVFKAIPMGSMGIVYQSGGVNPLWPFNEPLPTFGIVNPGTGTIGIRNLPQWVGPLGRGCVGGDSETHLMLSSDNELWRIDRNGFQATNLQASAKLSMLVPSTVRISLDPVNRDFFICGKDSGGTDVYSFCYSHSDGLTRCPKSASSISMFGGVVGGWAASVDASAVLVNTLPFNAGHPQVGGKAGTVGQVHAVRISTIRGDSTDGWKCIVYYRLTIKDDFTATSAVSFDDRGVAICPVPGIEWYVSLTHDDVTKTNGIDQISIDVEFGDKLSIRQWINASDPSALAVPTP